MVVEATSATKILYCEFKWDWACSEYHVCMEWPISCTSVKTSSSVSV